jgi:hypothetical protein
VIKELDTIALTTDLSEAGLRAGDLGTVVLGHQDGTGYEVEFMRTESLSQRRRRCATETEEEAD